MSNSLERMKSSASDDPKVPPFSSQLSHTDSMTSDPLIGGEPISLSTFFNGDSSSIPTSLSVVVMANSAPSIT